MWIQKLLLIALVCFAASADAHADTMRDTETRGTLTRPQDGQIAPDLWKGVNRDEALLLINALPTRYASPIYYDLALKFLLTDAAAPAAGKQADDAKQTDPARPDILIARLDKLLEMGALRDAQKLYDTLVTDTPDNFDLAYRNLQMLMLRGQLSAACLDLQAMQYQHGQNPRWKDLNNFCRIQFAQGPERERLLSATKFEAMPKLESILRGRGFTDIKKMSTDDLAYAVAMGVVGPSSIGLLSPKAASIQPLLLTVLLDMDTPEVMPQKTCLAIEAARRGLATTRDLITMYEKPHYDAALLLDEVGVPPSVANIHPCMIPTVMYQRIASNKEQPMRDKTIREALNVMKDLPDAAFLPMALYFRDFDVHQPVNKDYLWRIARIEAYEKGDMPESWLSGWAKEAQGQGVSPFWPVQAITNPGGDAKTDMGLWRSMWPTDAKRVDSRDPVIPLLLGEFLSGKPDKTGKNPKSKLSDYENIFSLTFSRSYAMPSYGLTQRLVDVIEKGQTGQSVALLLIGYGAIPPDQVIPHQMALVIDGMNKAGLARYARRFALEVLQ